MAGTIVGKVDCTLNETSTDNTAQAAFKNCYDFFMYLVSLGKCTRVARHTGRTTGTTLQQTTATDYYDGANPFLTSAFAVFKFPANAGRTYDFYVIIQWASSAGFASPGTPATFFGAGGTRSLAIGAAIGVGGSPWAGTTNFLTADPPSANDSKGASVWTDPGSGLYPFPRSNAAGGTHASLRQNMVGCSWGVTTGRQFFMADDDSFFMCNSAGDNGNYTWTYVGSYTPLSGTHPFPTLMVSYAGGSFLSTASLIGSLTGNGTQEGGIVSLLSPQVRGMSVDRLAGLVAIRRYPNTATGKTDEWPMTFYMNEAPNTGSMGQVSFIQECCGLVSHDANASPFLDRAVFGTTAVTDVKIVAPWKATLGASPRNSWTRSGNLF